MSGAPLPPPACKTSILRFKSGRRLHCRQSEDSMAGGDGQCPSCYPVFRIVRY